MLHRQKLDTRSTGCDDSAKKRKESRSPIRTTDGCETGSICATHQKNNPSNWMFNSLHPWFQFHVSTKESSETAPLITCSLCGLSNASGPHHTFMWRLLWFPDHGIDPVFPKTISILTLNWSHEQSWPSCLVNMVQHFDQNVNHFSGASTNGLFSLFPPRVLFWWSRIPPLSKEMLTVIRRWSWPDAHVVVRAIWFTQHLPAQELSQPWGDWSTLHTTVPKSWCPCGGMDTDTFTFWKLVQCKWRKANSFPWAIIAWLTSWVELLDLWPRHDNNCFSFQSCEALTRKRIALRPGRPWR